MYNEAKEKAIYIEGRRMEEDSIQGQKGTVAAFLAGGGQTGALMRAKDWAGVSIGRPELWPQSLRTALSICLNSRFPIVIWWGPDLVMLYNDAYASILASKHPAALGRPGRASWGEIWPIINPMLEGVLYRGEATWSEDQLLVIERKNYPEECYFTFSYSPIRDESGGIGGIFTAVTETTVRVLGERRLRTVRDLSAQARETRIVTEVCRQAAAVLAGNPADIPFSLIYLLDPAGQQLKLANCTGLEVGLDASPQLVALSHQQNGQWPLAEVVESGQCLILNDLLDRFNNTLPGGPWPDSPHTAVVWPIARPGQERPYGVFVAGVSPCRALDDDYQGFYSLVTDQLAAAIANARAYEEERQRADALAELDRAKTTFFSNISHEFRTPLTLLLSPLQEILVEAGDLSDLQQRERLQIAHRNALRLLKLVNTLLDFARLEANRISPNYQATDLASYTAELAGLFRSAIEQAGLKLIVNCPPLPQLVYLDREMWEKVVLNLLSNAFKFTIRGQIELCLHWHGSHVELTVRDTGSGIPAEELPRIFERFYRARSEPARSQEGSGIGLALVQDLLHLHSGQISVASVVGQGSTFQVLLPTGKADQMGATAPLASTAIGAAPFIEEALRWLPSAGAAEEEKEWAGPGQLPGPTSARILLADDNADMRDYLQRLLSQRWQVEAVADGLAALKAAHQRPPDLVLADVMMPGLDGFELLRALRADPHTREIPITLVSARAGEESRVEGLAAGADDYLVKPFSARELLVRVATQLQLADTRRQGTLKAQLSEQRAHRAAQDRDDVLSIVSHDLGNLLSAIRINTRVLLMLKEPGAAGEEELKMIQEAVELMYRLIQDLLDVAVIEGGQLVITPSRRQIAPLLHKAAEMMRPSAESMGFSLRVKASDELPPVLADSGRILQVLQNLISNAIKHGTPGEILVQADPVGDEVQFAVQDGGPGISADMLPHIFDRFWQARQRRGGAGLGLTISKGIVEAHGGRIWVESVQDKGSTFYFTLPVAG